MAISAPENIQIRKQPDPYRDTDRGRLIVHVSGIDAGQMRLHLELPGLESADEVREAVKLVIPGEISPLDPVEVVERNGRFLLFFFSADIANAGHLPDEAVACWEANGHENHMQTVEVIAAKQVEASEGDAAVDAEVTVSRGAYPRTVSLLAVGGLALALIGVVAVLLQS